MKRILLLVFAMIAMILQLSATKNDVPMEVDRKGNLDKPSNIHRTPMMLPIEVFFDDETRQVEISGIDDIDAEVCLCDATGITLAYSPVLNTVLDIPYGYHGAVVVQINSEDWVATGTIVI